MKEYVFSTELRRELNQTWMFVFNRTQWKFKEAKKFNYIYSAAVNSFVSL